MATKVKMLQSLWFFLAILLSVVGLFSFAAYRLFRLHSEAMILLVQVYRGIVDLVPLDFLAKRILDVIKFFAPVELRPDWKYFVVPALFYFTVDAQVFAQRGLRWAAFVSRVVGCCIAILLSVGMSLVFDARATVAVSAAVVSIVLYDVVMSAADPLLSKSTKYTWFEQFRYYLVRFPLVDAIIGVICIGLALFVGGVDYLVIVLSYLIALAIRDFVVAGVGAAAPEDGPSAGWLSRFRDRGSFKMGAKKLSAFLGAAGLVILDRFLAWVMSGS